MSDLQAIADRFEIEALRGEYTDALMMRDYDRLASLFTEDGVVSGSRMALPPPRPLRTARMSFPICSLKPF